jgi:hypothetical protein
MERMTMNLGKTKVPTTSVKRAHTAPKASKVKEEKPKNFWGLEPRKVKEEKPEKPTVVKPVAAKPLWADKWAVATDSTFGMAFGEEDK